MIARKRTAVGVADLGSLVGVDPDLALAALEDGSGEALRAWPSSEQRQNHTTNECAHTF